MGILFDESAYVVVVETETVIHECDPLFAVFDGGLPLCCWCGIDQFTSLKVRF